MNSFDREFLLYRILTGKLNHSSGAYIRLPSLSMLYDAAIIGKKYHELAISEGTMTDIDIKNFLIKSGLWTEKNEIDLNETLPKHIEHFKEELYKAYYQSSKQETVRKYLTKAKEELVRLMNIRHMYDHVSCAGVANYARLQFLVEKSTYKAGKRYNWNEASLYSMVLYYQDNLIQEDNIRELAHTNPWSITWSIGRKRNVFGRPTIKLGLDQQRLMMWSIMYDNVAENPNPPPNDVVEDNDMLDGWMSLERKKRQNKNELNIENQRINNADEIYLPVTDINKDLKDPVNYVKDAEKIDNLNTEFNKNLKKQRFKVIEKHGVLSEQNLPDIKQDLMMQMNKMGG